MNLRRFGLSTTVADARFAKPIDDDLVLRLAREHEVLITVEEGAIGGFGSQVLQLLARRGVLDRGLKVRSLVLPDVFIDQDSPGGDVCQVGSRCARDRGNGIRGAGSECEYGHAEAGLRRVVTIAKQIVLAAVRIAGGEG